MKILIIGLDGATWDVIDDYVLTKHMPNLRRLRDTGYWGILHSTEPAVTPTAWTTCITGCSPQTHGVAGFREYSFKDNTLAIGNATSSLVPNMWQELSAQGFSVASINVPWTYPCQQINGIMVAGHGAPGVFTYPERFRQKLFDAISDYDIVANWQRPKPNDGFGLLRKKIEHVERSFAQRLEIAELVTREIKWHVMMVVFQDLDKVGHYMWPYVSRELRDRYPAYRDRVFQMFAKLDENLGGLLALAGGEQAMVVVVSDHGMGRRLFDLKPNWLLHQWGYLSFRNPLLRMIRRIRLNFSSASLKKGRMSLELKMPIDWKRTKALLVRAEVSGHIYLNVKGRQPGGCVDPGKEYDAIIEDLRSKFGQLTCPASGRPIFEQITPSRQLYSSNVDVERFGDLVLVPRAGYFLKSAATPAGTFIEPCGEDSLQGCHSEAGIFVFAGPDIKGRANKEANMVDIAPTIYAALGAKLPRYMDGAVIEEMFKTRLDVRYQQEDLGPSGKRVEKLRMSSAEEEIVAKRLSELGYLD